MKYCAILALLFIARASFAQNWEVGIGAGLDKFKNVYFPPNIYYYGTTANIFPVPTIYAKRKLHRFVFMLSLDYFKRNASLLDTFQVPIVNTYPRAYKDSIAYRSEWKNNYYLVRLDGDYNVFNIKKVKSYIGISFTVLSNHEHFQQFQTVIDNNSKTSLASAETTKEIYIGLNYLLSYKASKHINIQNVIALTMGTAPEDFLGSFNQWSMILSESIGVGYVF